MNEKKLKKGCREKEIGIDGTGIPNEINRECNSDSIYRRQNSNRFQCLGNSLSTNRPQENIGLPYPTHLFLRDFRRCLSESGTLDKNLVNSSGRNFGLVKNEVFDLLFGLGESFVSNMLRRLKNSNFYTIAEDDLFQIRDVLTNKPLDKSKHCIALIIKYEQKNELFIRRHRAEIWHHYNPGFKGRFFKNIDDPEKGYWFGFAGADIHASKRGDYQIAINLAFKDICHLYTFCEVFGLNSEKPKDFFDKDGNHICVLRFGCKSMIEDLYGHRFTSSKSKNKFVPDPIKKAVLRAKAEKGKVLDIWQTKSGRIALAWLYGYYDGDGLKASTAITCGSKEMLEEIKELFDIYYDVNGKDGNYYLTVGAHLMNKMQSTYDKGLPRKRRFWDERNDRHIIFKRSLERAEITLNDIRDLVNYLTIEKLTKKFKCSQNFLSSFLSKNGVFVPKKKIHMPDDKKQYFENKFLKV